LELTERLIVKI